MYCKYNTQREETCENTKYVSVFCKTGTDSLYKVLYNNLYNKSVSVHVI